MPMNPSLTLPSSLLVLPCHQGATHVCDLCDKPASCTTRHGRPTLLSLDAFAFVPYDISLAECHEYKGADNLNEAAVSARLDVILSASVHNTGTA
jgi:hypothetical protein